MKGKLFIILLMTVRHYALEGIQLRGKPSIALALRNIVAARNLFTQYKHVTMSFLLFVGEYKSTLSKSVILISCNCTLHC